jgi:hypothetical protein
MHPIFRDAGALTPPQDSSSDYGPSAIKEIFAPGAWYEERVQECIEMAGKDLHDPLHEMPNWSHIY